MNTISEMSIDISEIVRLVDYEKVVYQQSVVIL